MTKRAFVSTWDVNPLTPELFFRQFLLLNLREALIVYRLRDATLLGNFVDDPFLNGNLNFGSKRAIWSSWVLKG